MTSEKILNHIRILRDKSEADKTNRFYWLRSFTQCCRYAELV